MTRQLLQQALDALSNVVVGHEDACSRFYPQLLCSMTALTAALAQPEPEHVQAGWLDEFGNVFPMGAWKPSKATYHDEHKTPWKPLFAAPPAPEANLIPPNSTELDQLHRDLAGMTAQRDADRLDSQRYRYMRDLCDTDGAWNDLTGSMFVGQSPEQFTAAIDAAMGDTE